MWQWNPSPVNVYNRCDVTGSFFECINNMSTSSLPTLNSRLILDALQRHKAFLKSLGVRKIGLFGSFRRGTNTAESDLDFLVQLDHPTFDSYMELKFFLEDLFNQKVDLIMEETLKPRLRPSIIEEVVYAEGL